MKFLFRADGNGQIGAGHIMRCLSIAQKAKEQGIDCVFLTADDSYYHKIMDAGIRCVVLGTDFRRMEDELPKLLEQLAGENMEKSDRIVVDSYYVTEKYLKALREVSIVAYLDDIASFAYPADILVNYNSYGSAIDYKGIYEQAKVSLPQLLLGPQFAPLRKEFQDIYARKVRDFVRDIFVSVGGSDPEHIMARMIEYLLDHHGLTENKQYHFVIGDFEPDQEKIFDMALTYPWIIPHRKVREMAKLMLSCDIAVSAAGSTLYELCACGIPTVTYVLEDNQILGASFFQKNQIMKSAGDFRYDDNWMYKLFGGVEELCSDKNLRKQMSIRAKKLVSGNGAEKIVTVLCHQIGKQNPSLLAK